MYFLAVVGKCCQYQSSSISHRHSQVEEPVTKNQRLGKTCDFGIIRRAFDVKRSVLLEYLSFLNIMRRPVRLQVVYFGFEKLLLDFKEVLDQS